MTQAELNERNEAMRQVLSILLSCGMADVDYIFEKAHKHAVDLVEIVEELVDRRNGQYPTANSVIHQLQVGFVGTIEIEDDKALMQGRHYSTFQSCLDSHVWAIEVPIRRDFPDQAEEIINAIKQW